MKRTILPMGPQHPVLPEPIVLDLILEDERVVDAIPTIGYIHRGLEAMVERKESLATEKVTEGRFVFVAIDESRQPIPITRRPNS